jgi:hypothetical protein
VEAQIALTTLMKLGEPNTVGEVFKNQRACELTSGWTRSWKELDAEGSGIRAAFNGEPQRVMAGICGFIAEVRDGEPVKQLGQR